jgi:hypothetical protein
LAEKHWEALGKMAEVTGSLGRAGPSWRVLIRRIAEGELSLGGTVGKSAVQVSFTLEQWEALQALLEGSGEQVDTRPQAEPQKAVALVSEPMQAIPERILSREERLAAVAGLGLKRGTDLVEKPVDDPSVGFLGGREVVRAPRTTLGDLRGEALEAVRAKPRSKFSQDTVLPVVRSVALDGGGSIDYTE